MLVKACCHTLWLPCICIFSFKSRPTGSKQSIITSGGSSSISSSASCLTSLGCRLVSLLRGLAAAGALVLLKALGLAGSGRASRASAGGARGFSGIQKPLLVVWPMPVPCEARSQPCMSKPGNDQVADVICQLQHAIPFVTHNWASGALFFTKLQPCAKLVWLTDASSVNSILRARQVSRFTWCFSAQWLHPMCGYSLPPDFTQCLHKLGCTGMH